MRNGFASTNDVRDNILAKILPEGETSELDATEFLSKLAERGFISFLPEDDHYPANLMEVLETIRQSGVTNMLDALAVAGLAGQMGETGVAEWIDSHRREYAGIIFNGRPNRETREVKPCADNAE